MTYLQQKRQDSSATSGAVQLMEAPQRGSNHLRGMSYAEGAAALQPSAPLQMKNGGLLQLKNKDKGPPPEIQALDLNKKLKVECPLSEWDKLDQVEKDAVLVYLTKQSAELDRSKMIKKRTVVISSKMMRQKDEEKISGYEDKIGANLERLNNGKGANNGGYIGINKSNKTTTKSDKPPTITRVPIKETKEMDAHIEAAGSTFDSADYKPEDMREGAVAGLLQRAVAKVQEYLAMDPNAKIVINVAGSESYVPNPDEFGPTELAAARISNCIGLSKQFFADAGLSDANITYVENNLGVNGPKWVPANGADNAMYTEHQFVRLDIEAEVEVETDKYEEIVTPNPDQSTKEDAELVKMSTYTKWKKQDKGKKIKQSGGRVRRTRVKKFKDTAICPVF